MPKLPNGTPDKYVALIDSLLTLDCTKRLQPTQFYNVVVKNYLIHKTNDGRWKIDLKQTTLSFSLVAAKAFNYVFSHKVVCLSAICLLALLYKKNQL